MGKKKQNNNKPQPKEQSNSSRKKQVQIWAIIAVLVLVFVGGWGGNAYYKNNQQTELLDKAKVEGVYRGLSGKHRAMLADSDYRFRETNPVMNPMSYRATKQIKAYTAAQKHPEVLDQIYCFCDCQKSIGHRSLLSCFTDNHAAMCGICQDQALKASEMTEEGRSLPEIIDAMDDFS